MGEDERKWIETSPLGEFIVVRYGNGKYSIIRIYKATQLSFEDNPEAKEAIIRTEFDVIEGEERIDLSWSLPENCYIFTNTLSEAWKVVDDYVEKYIRVLQCEIAEIENIHNQTKATRGSNP